MMFLELLLQIAHSAPSLDCHLNSKIVKLSQQKKNFTLNKVFKLHQ